MLVFADDCRFCFGRYRIASIRDLTVGYDSREEKNGFQPNLPVDPSSHMITYGFENGACLTLRTSGTEPKIKYYLEVCHVDKNECESRRWGSCRIVELADEMEKEVLRVVFGKE